MTCKDCIHYDVCLSRISFGMDCDDVTGKDIEDIEKRCKKFAEKALFIELPCKVGDKIFFIIDGHDEVHMDIITEVTTRSYSDLFLGLKTPSYFSGLQISKFPFEAFGKMFFSTYEEAEKALKARANK